MAEYDEDPLDEADNLSCSRFLIRVSSVDFLSSPLQRPSATRNGECKRDFSTTA